jgi:hypothetical protein
VECVSSWEMSRNVNGRARERGLGDHGWVRMRQMRSGNWDRGAGGSSDDRCEGMGLLI